MRLRQRTIGAWIVGATVLLSAFGALRAAEEKAAGGGAVSEKDKLEFTQKNVQAQMHELQDRMFHLAEVTREAEPENSTRLLLAVRKARELLIIEQMKEVLEQLSARDLSKAGAETSQVIVKLTELKNLLIATDLELQLQLERLRKLQAAIRQLDQAIKQEQRQQGQSTTLAELHKKAAEVKPAQWNQAKQDEAANHQRTDTVAKTVKDLGSLEAAEKPLAAAGTSMSSAEKSLGESKPGEAQTQQSDATKKLEEARAELEKERQRVLQELERQVKRVVIENLQEMLDRQTAVRQANETLADRLAREREAVVRLQQLAPAEQRIAAICQQTLDLVTETEFSVALPPALDDLQRRMLYVMGDLTGGRGDQTVIASELSIERDLKDLLETFKQLPASGQSNSQCKSCKSNKNKLLAELKVIRMLQSRVNDTTVEADKRRAKAVEDLPPELREKIGKIRNSEESVRDAMDRLHHQYCPDCFAE